jgi:hypothetical protein
MAKPLAFKVQSQKKSQVEAIGNELTGVLELPRFGCVTPAEEIAIADYLLAVDQQSVSELKFDIATLLLQFRHDSEWTKADTKREIEDFQLIEGLYEFFSAERRRHSPNNQVLKVEGEDAQAIALDFAEPRKLVVATRSDFKSQNVWFVFASAEAAPEDFDVDADFSEPVEVKDLAVGKSK